MKIKKFFIFSMLLFIIATITNCTVQKRSYRNGYYVSWNKKASPLLKFAKHVEAKKVESKNISSETLNIKSTDTQEPLYASVQKLKKSDIKSSVIKPLKLANDSCGDLITLRDGTDIEARVIEVGSKAIKYKRCNNIEGPTIVVNVENVFMIKYANGTKEIFKKEEVKEENTSQYSQQQQQIVEKKTNGMAIASIATFVLYFTIIFAPLPFIFGLIALYQIKKNSEKYKGKWMAIVGVVPGFIALLILLIMILSVL